MALDNRNKKPTTIPEIQETLEQADVVPVVPEEEVVIPSESEDQMSLVDDVVEEEKEEEKAEEPEASKDDELDRLKTRYADSSREALVLYSKNKKLTDTIIESKAITAPTDEEMAVYCRENGAEFEELDDLSKNIMRKNFVFEKRFAKIDEVSDASKALDMWVGKVEAFIDDPDNAQKYPAIVANAEDFKAYCLKQDKQNIDLDLLSAGFLFNNPRSKLKNNGSLLLNRGSSKETPNKPKGITIEDLARIRLTDPSRHKALIKSGVMKKIVID